MKKAYLPYNILLILLLTLSAFRVDPFRENYSTYTTRGPGYFFVLFLGAACAFSHYIAFRKLSTKRNAVLIASSFLIASVLPYEEDPSTLLANIHVLLAYAGFALYLSEMILFFIRLPERKRKVTFPIYMFSLTAAAVSYMKMLCVNAFSEWIVLVTGIILLTCLCEKR